MTETTSNEDQPATEGDRIAQLLTGATTPDAVARTAVLALLLIADQVDDIRLEIAEVAATVSMSG